MSKAYNPQEFEDKIYEKWEKSGFFNPDNLEKAGDRFWNAEPFSIAMPPPNVTAELHLGSALFITLQDIMTRHARMRGRKALWLPGTDHAAIATQNVVERKILEEEKKTRTDLGREQLLRRIEEFVSHTQGRIQNQIRKMGSSCDWTREKFTLSPELSLAVRTAFKKMHDAGLIYRGERMVNWCPRCGSTLADDEVSFKQAKGHMFYLRYPVKDSEDYLVVATNRPETMLGDTGVAVNPGDSRYKKYVGKIIMLPLLNREVPVIADDHIDKAFGTGAMKVTPGHDHNDFEIAKRHGLEMIHLYTADGKIDAQEAADHGFDDYAGLTKEDALNRIVQELHEKEFIEKTEEIEHRVGTCYRCGTVVEPVVSKQWFVNVNAEFKIENKEFSKNLRLPEKTTLKEMMTAAVKSGAIKIVPKHFEKIYFEWMKNLRDWTISRQIWYGHRIPVWYCPDCTETIVAVEPPASCTKCQGANLKQDEDTLDTWFSSGLWTFSTLGWPQETSDLKTYHPTVVLETAYDILFFWVARMVLMTRFLLNDIPFKTVYLHGLVRDIEGKKMSKSSGNRIDPLDIQAKYGTDALRLSLVLGNTPGNDMKFSEIKVEAGRNFVNKLWNISRFILSTPPLKVRGGGGGLSTLADHWILDRLDETVAAVNRHFENSQYGQAAEELQRFTWDDLADWYLEIAKIEGNKKEVLDVLLVNILKLWHPFIPFVTEHIWSQMAKSLLMVDDYPHVPEKIEKFAARPLFEAMRELVTGLRNLRAEYRLGSTPIYSSYLEIPKDLEWIKDHTPVIEKLTRTKLNFAVMDHAHKMPYFLWEGVRIYLVIPNFDSKKEAALTEKQLKEAESYVKKISTQVKNKGFLKKAPKEIVEKMQADLSAAETKVKTLKAKVKQLK